MDGCSKEHDRAAKRNFWKELWIHNPHTKKVKDLGTGGHNQVRYPRNSSFSTSIWSVCCARNIGALCNLESLLAHHVATYQSRYQHWHWNQKSFHCTEHWIVLTSLLKLVHQNIVSTEIRTSLSLLKSEHWNQFEIRIIKNCLDDFQTTKL